MTDHYTLLIKKLEELRSKSKLTQKEFGEAIGHNRQWYYDVMKRKDIKMSDLAEVAEYFKVPVEWFFQADSNQKKESNHNAGEENAKYLTREEKLSEELIKQLKDENKILREQIEFLKNIIEKKL